MGGHRGDRPGEGNDAVVVDRAGPRKGFRRIPAARSAREKIPGIIAAAEKYEGRPYDIHYDMDDEKTYCSELLYKSVRDATGKKIGRIRKLGDLKWQPYEKVIRSIENGGLPLEREMITPRDFSEAPELQEIFRSRM